MCIICLQEQSCKQVNRCNNCNSCIICESCWNQFKKDKAHLKCPTCRKNIRLYATTRSSTFIDRQKKFIYSFVQNIELINIYRDQLHDRDKFIEQSDNTFKFLIENHRYWIYDPLTYTDIEKKLTTYKNTYNSPTAATLLYKFKNLNTTFYE